MNQYHRNACHFKQYIERRIPDYQNNFFVSIDWYARTAELYQRAGTDMERAAKFELMKLSKIRGGL